MKNKKETAFIRSDGWVFSSEGMEKLKEGGRRGHARFMKSIEDKLGKWHRVCKPLDKDAVAILKRIKGMTERALFLAKAITKEVKRCEKGTHPLDEVQTKERAEFMRLTLTEDAYQIVAEMPNSLFRCFVSSAIKRADGK